MASVAAPAPSRFQLALALAVAKTKPVGVTIREYLTKIRHHVLDGSPAEDYGSRAKYIDAAGHWQSMYEKSLNEVMLLQTTISILEQDKKKLQVQVESTCQNPIIKVEPVSRLSTAQPVAMNMTRSTTAQSRAMEPPRPSTAQSRPMDPPRPSTAQPRSAASRKRQNPFKDSTQTQHKKLKTPTTQGAAGGNRDAPIVIADDLTRFEEPRDIDPGVTRHLLSIHKLYQDIAPDCGALAYHLVEAAKAVTKHITTRAIDLQNQFQQASIILDNGIRARRTAAAVANLSGDYKKSQRAAARSFSSLFHGLYTLWVKGIESGRRNHGVATYEMICAFDSVLSAIETTCGIQASMNDEEGSISTGVNASKRSRTKRIIKAPVPQELTSLALALLSTLTPMHDGPHSAFFEGFLYLLLDRIGKKLSLFTFKHAPCATIPEEILLGHQEEVEVDCATLKATHLEVQFFVQLMERAMSLAPAFLGSQSSIATTNRPGSARPSSARPGTASRATSKSAVAKPSLSLTAKEKLQHTLIRCMLGEFPKTARTGDSSTGDEEDAPNNEFVDVLRKPVRIGQVPPPPKVDDLDLPNWFRGEIWRLVGWDLLSREDGW